MVKICGRKGTSVKCIVGTKITNLSFVCFDHQFLGTQPTVSGFQIRNEAMGLKVRP